MRTTSQVNLIGAVLVLWTPTAVAQFAEPYQVHAPPIWTCLTVAKKARPEVSKLSSGYATLRYRRADAD